MADIKGAGAGAEKKTLIEEGTTFKGSVSSTCAVVVRGSIDGDVAAPSLTVAASGSVHGTVKVGAMRSEGALAGEFDADVVLLSGSVKDQTVIRAKSLEVKLQPASGKMQVTFGECALDVGDPATKEAALSAASSSGGSVPPRKESAPGE